MNWFLGDGISGKDKGTTAGSITVNTEMYDDPSIFLSPNVTDINAVASTIPFVTEVACTAGDGIHCFNEDMIVYEFEPVYQDGDSISVLRFRGLDSNNVYTFFGVKPGDKNGTGAVFFYDPPDRSTRDNLFNSSSSPPDLLCVATGGSVQIIIYDSSYTLVNPLTLAIDPNVFAKPSGPQVLSPDILRFGENNGGVVSTSHVPYFVSVESIPLLGSIKLAPPRVVPQSLTTEAATTYNSQTQPQPSNPTTDTQSTLFQAVTQPTPQDRAAAANAAKKGTA